MGHKRKRVFKKIFKNDVLKLSIGALGVGIILVIFLPVRVWIAIVGFGLIGISWYCYCK